MPYPSWKHNPKLIVPSIANLSTTININGSDGTTVFAYRGIDATTAIWPAVVGSQLTKVEVGADVTPNYGSPLLGATDDSVLYNGADFHQYAADATYGDVTTEHFYMEVLFTTPTVLATEALVGKSGLTTGGYNLLLVNTGILKFYVGSTAPMYNTAYVNTALTAGALIFCSCFFDPSQATLANGVLILFNGISNTNSYGTVHLPNAIANLTNMCKFTIGALHNSTSLFKGSVLWTLGAKKASWFAGEATNPTQWIAFHQARFNALFGLNAQIGNGTLYPTATRACPAYSRKIESGATRYYLIGTEIPRTESILDASSNSVEGMMAEPAGTNVARYSEAAGSLTLTRCAIDANNVLHPAPHKGKYFDGIIADEVDSTHRLSADFIGNTSVQKYCFSCFMKKGNKNWVKVYIYSTSGIGIQRQKYFNLDTGATGTGDANAGMIDFGNGIYRCWMSPVVDLAVETSTLYIFTCDDDNDDTCIGDSATVNTWIWGWQFEVGTYPTSYIPVPSTAAVTRLADTIYYKGDDGNLGNVGSDKQGTIYVEFLYNPSVVPAATLPIFQINDGGASADSIVISIDTSGYLTATFTATAGTPRVVAGPAVSVCDRLVHNLRLAYRPGRAILFLDGAAGVEQTAIVLADIPDDLDRIRHDAGHTVIYPRSGFLRRPNWSGRLYIQ